MTEIVSMTMAHETDNSLDSEDAVPACILVFNASDPSGAGGVTGDALTIASVGSHPLPIVTGVYVRDTAEIFDHIALDEEAVAEQARAVLEDLSVQVIKVGFCGTPETLSTIAEITADYADVPVVAYMPNLAWWQEGEIDNYLDAFRELMLPQTTLLVGNHNTLWRWLLPDWSSEKPPSARDIARAAAEKGTPYTLVTGISTPDQFIDNVLAAPNSVLLSERVERFDAVFAGAGDTLSAALAGLLASGTDLQVATTEALTYLDHSLNGGFRPGMGHVIADRLFWAPQDDNADPQDEDNTAATAEDFSLPRHETKH
ncbi:MAG: hydroxymethylpyrimidine/phosphomethylpyrimidine kinase [Betaproteobacteria bacterium]|nr:hydroxymethylpyrimidine/phosphomethylpyrimidine kinase [Betaproteobacteria bacterium]